MTGIAIRPWYKSNCPSHPSSLPFSYMGVSSIKIYSNVILSWHLLFDGPGLAHLPCNIDFKIPKGNHKTSSNILKYLTTSTVQASVSSSGCQPIKTNTSHKRFWWLKCKECLKRNTYLLWDFIVKMSRKYWTKWVLVFIQVIEFYEQYQC